MSVLDAQKEAEKHLKVSNHQLWINFHLVTQEVRRRFHLSSIYPFIKQYKLLPQTPICSPTHSSRSATHDTRNSFHHTLIVKLHTLSCHVCPEGRDSPTQDNGNYPSLHPTSHFHTSPNQTHGRQLSALLNRNATRSPNSSSTPTQHSNPSNKSQRGVSPTQ